MLNIRYFKLFAAGMIACLLQTSVTAASDNSNFEDAVTLNNLISHLKVFQRIADNNEELPGTRFTSTQGYNESRDYIINKLTEAGYQVTVQDVPMDLMYVTTPRKVEQITPAAKSYVDNIDYAPLMNSGGADVTAALQMPESDGCSSRDYATFKSGNIALVKIGNKCNRTVAIENAVTAGAKAVMVNYPDLGVITFSWNPASMDKALKIPVMVISNDMMSQFKQAMTAGTAPVIHINFNAVRKTVPSQNVFAESKAGDPNHVVMMGAHIDSTPASSGMNDNASAIAVVLETALLMKDTNPEKKLRFAFWTGEELGLLGSNYYVANLSPAEIAKIDAYFNYEDLGASNGGRMIMGASRDNGSKGSENITRLYANYFKSKNLKYFVFNPDMGNASARSDMSAFMHAGIPVGFIASGANIPWNSIFATIFTDLHDRVLGVPTHPCYHKACDTLTLTGDELKDPNFDFDLYLQMSKAAAYAVYVTAMQ